MTPKRIKCGWIITNVKAYELSSGTGIYNEPIFGVTVSSSAEWERPPQDFEDSDCFGSLHAAEKYILKLKAKYKGIEL